MRQFRKKNKHSPILAFVEAVERRRAQIQLTLPISSRWKRRPPSAGCRAAAAAASRPRCSPLLLRCAWAAVGAPAPPRPMQVASGPGCAARAWEGTSGASPCPPAPGPPAASRARRAALGPGGAASCGGVGSRRSRGAWRGRPRRREGASWRLGAAGTGRWRSRRGRGGGSARGGPRPPPPPGARSCPPRRRSPWWPAGRVSGGAGAPACVLGLWGIWGFE